MSASDGVIVVMGVFFECNRFWTTTYVPDMYFVLMYEGFNNLSLVILNMMEKSLYAYIPSGSVLLLSAIRSASEMLMLRVDSAKGDVSLDLNVMYKVYRIRGLLQGKDFRALKYVFPFIQAFWI